MTCRRAYEPELLTLVHGEGDAELRTHVDGCADCAAELAVWRELDGLLQIGVAPVSEHPAPDALVAFADAPAALAPAARLAIERHLAGCRPCADELRGLASFAPAAVVSERADASAPGRAQGAVPSIARLPAAASDATAARRRRGLGAILWHPVFAYALVVLLLVPLLRGQMPQLTYETRAVDERRDAPLLPPAEAPRPDGAVGAAPAPPAAPRSAPPAGAPAAAVRAGSAPAPRRAPASAEHDASAPAQALADGVAGHAERPQAADGATVAAAQPKEERGGAAPPPDDLRAEAARAKASQGPLAPSADAVPPAGANAVGPGAPLLRLELRPQRPTIFGAEVLGRPLQLRMFPPAELARGPLTVTIRGRANRQQLTTISTNDANAVAVALPADWLAPGDYAVTLQPVQNGLEPAGQPALFGFTVRAPTAR